MADILITVDKQPKPRLLERKISLEMREAGSVTKNRKFLSLKIDAFLIVVDRLVTMRHFIIWAQCRRGVQSRVTLECQWDMRVLGVRHRGASLLFTCSDEKCLTFEVRAL